MTARVVAIASDTGHNFTKPVKDVITLIKGEGVKDDAHCGVTVQHLSDKRKTPDAPNLRQVHLMHAELFDELAEQGIAVSAGQMGENITTQGVDILNLPLGTRLQFGDAKDVQSRVQIEITGLRSPCRKLTKIDPNLLKAVVAKDKGGAIVKSGIMSIVLTGGKVRAGDMITVILPDTPHIALKTL